MHDEHTSSRSEVWLGRQLRDAARREQPPFSEALHQRIMQAVRPAAAVAAAAEPVVSASVGAERRRRVYWRSAAWLTAAAAAILAMVVAARWFAGSDNHGGSQPSQSTVAETVGVQPGSITKQSVATAPSKSIDDTSPAVEPSDNDIASVAKNYTLDDLSRDAQATAHLLVDQLPFETPADEWGL